MNLKSLKIFCDIVTRRSFSRAAEDNGISQSGASQVRIARSMALPHRSSGRWATREPREERPGRPERVSRNAPHPLRWRFSRVSRRPRPSSQFPDMRGSRPAPLRACC